MTVDKRMKYEMQGGSKPARNYLGAQKTVSGVPVKWKSGPDHPETELAYITKAEKDLLVKKDLHGSLKNGPNTGPDGIMSLDSQGDYTRDFSSAGKAPGRSPQQSNYMNKQIQKAHDQKTKDFYTGNLSPNDPRMHSTSAPGPRTRQYSNLPEWVVGPGGKRQHAASAYKSYGQPSFFGNLFSRGAPGYRGIEGLSAFGTPTFQTKKRDDGSEYYYTEDENFGETKSAVPFGIMGILDSIANKFRKPRALFEGKNLVAPEDQKVYIPEGMDSPMASLALAQYRTPGTLGAIPITPKNTMFDDSNQSTTDNAIQESKKNPSMFDEVDYTKTYIPNPGIVGTMMYESPDNFREQTAIGNPVDTNYAGEKFVDLENPYMVTNDQGSSPRNTVSDMIVPIGINADQKDDILNSIKYDRDAVAAFRAAQAKDATKWWGGKKDTHIRPNEFIEFWEKQTGQPMNESQKQKILAQYT